MGIHLPRNSHTVQVRLNGEGYGNVEELCIYKKFEMFGDYLKKSDCKNRFKRGKGGKSSIDINLEVFQRLCSLDYTWNNILMARKLIFQLRNKKLKKFLSVNFDKLIFKMPFMKLIILDLVKFKFGGDFKFDCEENSGLNTDYCVVRFLDLGFERLQIPKLLNLSREVFPLKKQTRIRTAFKYNKTLKKLICNYNYFCKNLVKIDDTHCYCQRDEYRDYVDPDYGHIITGDLNIIDSIELKNVLARGTKFRLREIISNNKILIALKQDLDRFIAKIARKYHTPIESFIEWKTFIVEGIKSRLKGLKHDFGRGIFINEQIIKDIEKLKNRFIITVVDKAANNFCIICKYFYKDLILKEYKNKVTYNIVKNGKKELDKIILAFSKKLKVRVATMSYPYLFSNVKFHKTPIKFRFVACSTNCYNYNMGKQFFKILDYILKKIDLEENFIINNNGVVLNFLESNKVENMYTFDFENLYTSLPHEKLLDICRYLYENYLADYDLDRSFWTNLCNFCISENYLFNGIFFCRQVRGIPMGASFSGALANIVLHCYESKAIKNNLIYGFRYIDDLLILNEENINNIIKCYPEDLILNRTNRDTQSCTFLDLNLKVEGGNITVGVCDKRDDFQFKVIKLCNFETNLNKRVLKNVIFAQALRIRKICNNKNSYLEATKALVTNLYENLYPFNFCNLEYAIVELQSNYVK